MGIPIQSALSQVNQENAVDEGGCSTDKGRIGCLETKINITIFIGKVQGRLALVFYAVGLLLIMTCFD